MFVRCAIEERDYSKFYVQEMEGLVLPERARALSKGLRIGDESKSESVTTILFPIWPHHNNDENKPLLMR